MWTGDAVPTLLLSEHIRRTISTPGSSNLAPPFIRSVRRFRANGLAELVFLTCVDSSAKLMRLWENYVNRLQPSLHQFWPPRDRKIRAPQAVAVSPVCVDVHFRGHFGVLQRQEINCRILDMHRIVFSLNNERW